DDPARGRHRALLGVVPGPGSRVTRPRRLSAQLHEKPRRGAPGNPAGLPVVPTAIRMRAPMGFRLTLSPALPALLVAFAVATVAILGACGREIGDSCTTSTDCSPNG